CRPRCRGFRCRPAGAADSVLEDGSPRRRAASRRCRTQPSVDVDGGREERDAEHEEADDAGDQTGAEVLAGELSIHVVGILTKEVARPRQTLTASTIVANSSARDSIE